MKSNLLFLIIFIANWSWAEELSPITPVENVSAQKMNELIIELNQVVNQLTSLKSLAVDEPVSILFEDRTDNIPLTTIPKDDTVPQITEGTSIFNIIVTPTKIGNELLIESQISGLENTNTDDTIVSSMFINNQTNAIVAGMDGAYTHGGTNLQSGTVKLAKKITVTSLTPIPIMIRAGIANGTLNRMWLYDGTAKPNFGNTTSSWIKVTEINK